MAATLQSIRDRQDNILANSKTGSFSETERVQAINDAIKEIMYFAEWPQLTVSADISFTTGVGSLPTGFFKAIRLYEENSDDTVKTEYEFIEQADSISQNDATYTITDNGSGTQVLKIYDNETITLRFWYIKRPFSTDLASGSDVTGLDADFDLPIAMISSARLIRNKNKTSQEPNIILYGVGGESRYPTDDSAFGLLGKLLRHYKKYAKRYTRQFRYFHDTYSFYS